VLELSGLRVAYGGVEVVHGVDLRLVEGEVLGLIGPNGAGKTSILRALCGLHRPSGGSVTFEGRKITGLAPEQVARLGLALVPEGRRIFGTLSVEENLRLADGGGTGKIAAMGERFPVLAERARTRADRLSGGEQQQLAIARALVTGPRVLVLDEPSLGLAPKLIDQTYALLAELRAEGVTMLLVEQNARRTIDFCDRTILLGGGRVRAEGSREELRRNPDVVRAYLGRAP
jgi:branched-chain amino acid transport system ATP-binding protein